MNETTGRHVEPETLLALLGEQCELYRALRDLGVQQRKLIAGDRPELLLSVLTQRQRAVVRLAAINVSLGPVRRDWTRVRAGLGEPYATRASQLLDEAATLADSVMRDDAEDAALLGARRQALGDSLGELHDARTASGAYGRTAPNSSNQADFTG